MKASIVNLYNSCKGNYAEITKTLHIFYVKYLSPVIGLFSPLWHWLIPRYVSMYKSMAYKDGVHVASRGAAALATLLFGTIISVYANLFVILPFVATLTYDAVAYNLFSYKTEKLYFSSPQWVDSTGAEGDKVLSVFSCDTRHCDADSSTEYRFRDSIYLDTVKWITKFEPYDPADVAGILLSELNYCSVKAYGKRFKPLDWYPYIYDIECTVMPPQETG